MVFIFFGTYFIANLFASVVVEKYDRMEQFYSGMLFLSEKQKVWVIDSQQVIRAKPIKILRTPIIPLFEKIVIHPYFDHAIMAVILLNILTLAIQYEGISAEFLDVLAYANIVFVSIFAAEMASSL